MSTNQIEECSNFIYFDSRASAHCMCTHPNFIDPYLLMMVLLNHLMWHYAWISLFSSPQADFYFICIHITHLLQWSYIIIIIMMGQPTLGATWPWNKWESLSASMDLQAVLTLLVTGRVMSDYLQARCQTRKWLIQPKGIPSWRNRVGSQVGRLPHWIWST